MSPTNEDNFIVRADLPSNNNRLQGFFWHIADHFIPHERNSYVPHLIHNRSLSLYAVLLVVVKVSVVFATVFSPGLPVYSSAITKENVFRLTNESREINGVKPLKYNNLLDTAAQNKAEDMLARQYFSHNSPTNETPWVFIQSAGYDYIVAGENLAVDFVQAETMEDAWMNSPGHRANILNKNYEDIGIGIAAGDYKGHRSIFVVQMFGTLMPQGYKQKPVARTTPRTKPIAKVKGETTPAPSIIHLDISPSQGNVLVTLKTSAPVFKVIGTLADQQIMFEAKPENTWIGEIAIAQLKENTNLNVELYNTEGKVLLKQVASIAPDLASNYNPDVAKSSKRSIFGFIFDLKQLEYIFFGFFVAILLSVLVLKIGIKRHIQHIETIANTSALVIFATILWHWV
ncbi:MAG TPA: CAP domain-containing protein [Patescibacteria group bacterium]|nr:CAP domain-containing protein [Patescibacteria group bacterium]